MTTYPHNMVKYFKDQQVGAADFFTHEDKLYYITKTYDERTKVIDISIFGPITEDSEFYKLETQIQSQEENHDATS